jgi:6,7-dimethyl-8-ribityllumazine synthase
MAKLPKTPTPRVVDVRLALITSEFNEAITDRMRQDAIKEAKKYGAEVVIDVRAPGVYDIPFLADQAMERSDIHALVALGAVVTGQTKHDEIVTHNAARILADLAIKHRKPVGLGITGPGQTEAQARARIDRAAFAVRSVLKQLSTLRELS